MFQSVYPGQGTGYKATCAAAGTVCRNPPTALKLNGQRITSQYCQFHACRQVDGGRACPNAKLPRAVVCSQHIRCQAVDNGTRCNIDVKDGNSALYRYCTPLPRKQIYVHCLAVRLNGRGITAKIWRFAMNIAANTTPVETIKMPPLLKELIQMTLNASVSDTVTAKNHNADVSVTSVTTVNPHPFVAHTTARHPTAKPNVRGEPTAAITHVLSKAASKARSFQEVVSAKSIRARRAIVGLEGLARTTALITSACMAAVKLRRWRVVIAKDINNAPRSVVRIGGILFKGQHASYAKTICMVCVQATTIDEAVVDEQNEAHDSANTIFARFVTVKTQKHLRSNSALVTSVLCQNVTDLGNLQSTDLPREMLTDSFATDTAVGKLVATTRLRRDQAGA
ncbi:hypothetical protein NCS52_00037300 [Fusarium sp. LHS14.1]|nr:hypothetical protein NCS52_00037300 [Fusarium sp. LHS14.1]